VSDDLPVTRLPARDIPVPRSVSPQAQAILARGAMIQPAVYPPLDDHQAWRDLIAAGDAELLKMLPAPATPVVTEDRSVNGVAVYVATPDGVAAADRRVYLEIHGGSWTRCGGAVCRVMAARAAVGAGARTWSIDYRMPPDHPYPAALDDCVAVYRGLLAERRPEEVIVSGTSAGGNLAAALALRVRDEGLPPSAGLVLNTPATDFTFASDTRNTNLGLDIVLTDNDPAPALLYAAGHDPRDPYLSPVYGDFTPGYPPAILLSGTRDILLSDTVRLHRALRAAGCQAELHVFEAAGHGGFLGMAPDDAERSDEIRRFLDRHWAHG
jgi:acetyl esterase/lipase